jgi:sRNA-binding carbon storage regulator CsrA
LRVGDVTFQIVRFGPGRRVTVRIKAPPHIEIVRSEIDERKEKAT